ncbi:CSMD3 [Branchiostoma lanceolatum]|uniref:CSMD3 protein n=1 Tax=Branchiostoma lanceolatum TaxID=7740 RepID=A0A8J9ZEQ6_BRALA|nr:CSMD3 [Branchiostoma lanceolatum]
MLRYKHLTISHPPTAATQQSCRDPGTPDHGSRNATNFLPGTVVRFQCQDGYHILGPTSLICDPATLSWNGQPPTCVL